MSTLLMKKLLRLYSSLAVLSLLSLTGCGGGYGESTNSYLSENRANARSLLNNGNTMTPTTNPNSLDTALLAKGASDYEQQCASCHGSDGQAGIPLVNCGSCASLETLSKRIFDTMPPGGGCDQDCADATAYYILAGFPNPSAISASPTPVGSTAPTATPSPKTNPVSGKPIALITNPTSDLLGFASHTATFASNTSSDDTGITRTQWFVNNVEQTQASSFTNTFAEGRYRVKLVVTDQDNQTAETSVVVNAVTNGQAAEDCDGGNVFMAKKLWTSFFNNCLACHRSGGVAAGSRLVLFNTSDKFYLNKNYDRVSSLLLGTSNLLRDKAQGRSHGGGIIVPASNTTVYNNLIELQKRVNTPPTACTTP